MTQSKHKIYLLFPVVIALVVGGAIFVASERQNIYDELALIHYHPPSTIVDLANQDGMTSYTRKVFYVNHPKIDSKSSFAIECPNSSIDTAILGCYHLGQQGIYLLSVNNSDLYGIEQATAAYETLHAIYQRLDSSEQKTLNNQLISFENTGLNSPIIKAQIAGFRKTEPGGVLNEMTSLFGTEVPNLPPDLNSFYAKYFINRQVVVNYYLRYQTAFTSREQQISTDGAVLNGLYSQITSDKSQLSQQLAAINAEQTSLESEQSAGEINQYNKSVPSYNQQVDEYNSLASSLSTQVSQYNQLVASRNSMVLEEQQLTSAISSPNYHIDN